MLLFQERCGRVILLHLLIRLTVAVGELGNFTNPSHDALALTYTLGSRVLITWETRLERIRLTLCVYEGVCFALLNTRNVTNTGTHGWVVGDVVDHDNYPTTVTHVTDVLNKLFRFVIFKPGTTEQFGSQTFTILPGVSSSTSATTSSSSMSPSSASSSSFITSTSPASLATSSSSMSSSSALTSSFILSTSPASSATTSVPPSPTATVTIYALSQRAKTGMGVGIGLGIPLLLSAVGIYLGWRFRGGRDTPDSSRASIVDTPCIDPQRIDPPFIVEAPNSSRPPELPDSNHPMAHEMSDHASR